MNKDSYIRIRMTKEMKKAVQKFCRKKKITLSDLIRDYLTKLKEIK